MKRKVKKERTWIFIAIFLILFFTICWFLNARADKYKIYKEVCHNETKNILSIFPQDFLYINCPDIITSVECYDYNENIIKDLKCEKDIRCWKFNDKNYSEYLLTEERRAGYSIFSWYKNSLYITSESPPNYHYELQSSPISSKETIEVCEKKEVKEKSIKEAWDICWKHKLSEKDFVICSLMEEGKIDWGEWQDYGKNWFNENCECENICFEQNWFYQIAKKQEKCLDKMQNFPTEYYNHGYYCKEYKCGDYIVEKI